MHEMNLTIVQWTIFALASLVFSLVLPNYLKSSLPDVPQGVDRYLGTKRSVKKVGWDLKISLDGVDYLVESDDEISSWDKVEVTWHAGASMKVKKSQ
jgi:membrane protein implicated in regulation of membrane protease activity